MDSGRLAGLQLEKKHGGRAGKMKHWLACICFVAVLASCTSNDTKEPEQRQKSSLLRDYVVTPIDRAKGARNLVEKRYEQEKKILDKLAQ